MLILRWKWTTTENVFSLVLCSIINKWIRFWWLDNSDDRLLKSLLASSFDITIGIILDSTALSLWLPINNIIHLSASYSTKTLQIFTSGMPLGLTASTSSSNYSLSLFIQGAVHILYNAPRVGRWVAILLYCVILGEGVFWVIVI